MRLTYLQILTILCILYCNISTEMNHKISKTSHCTHEAFTVLIETGYFTQQKYNFDIYYKEMQYDDKH